MKGGLDRQSSIESKSACILTDITKYVCLSNPYPLYYNDIKLTFLFRRGEGI